MSEASPGADAVARRGRSIDEQDDHRFVQDAPAGDRWNRSPDRADRERPSPLLLAGARSGDAAVARALDARDPTGVAPWTLFVSPPGVLGLPHESGGAGTVVAVQPAPGADAFRASWVSGADFERLLQQARHFVADGHDLCRLLLERSDVVHGELTTWHYQRFAARVVKALLLAPHLATGKPRNALWLSCTAGRRSRSHPPGGRTSSRWPAGGLER